jgi:hypothetical protein
MVQTETAETDDDQQSAAASSWLPLRGQCSHARRSVQTPASGANEYSRATRAGALDRATSDSADARDGASPMASVLAGRRPSGERRRFESDSPAPICRPLHGVALSREGSRQRRCRRDSRFAAEGAMSPVGRGGRSRRDAAAMSWLASLSSTGRARANSVTAGLTQTEPSGRTDSGRFGLLLWISGRPERQPTAGFPGGDNSEVLSVRVQLLVLDADALSDRAASPKFLVLGGESR